MKKSERNPKETTGSCSFAPLCVATMARSFAPALLVLATLIALVLPQLGLCAATLTHSEGQVNVNTSLSTPTSTHESYCVFASFRGNDTRTSFTAYLFVAFHCKTIYAYRFDVGLPRRGEIEAEKMKAIKTSRIVVIVFSKNYAPSWCLEDLGKIMECKRLLNKVVIPIFYEVSQSMVLEQKEIFAEALLNGPMDKVNNWRTASKKATLLAGLHLKPDR